MSMKLMVLAGGYGTRLYPLIKDSPKALLDVAGKTLIDHTIDKFIHVVGINELVVVTNAKFHAQMEGWRASRKDLPFPVRVINDGTTTPEDRLGAIGDLLFVLDKEDNAHDWIIVGSDNLFDQNVEGFVSAARSRSQAPTVGCFDIKSLQAAVKYGVMKLDDQARVLELQEKPAQPVSTLISMCLYFLPAATLPLVRQYVDETGKTDTTGGYVQWLFLKIPVYGFKFEGHWYDIGSFESYEEAKTHYQNQS